MDSGADSVQDRYAMSHAHHGDVTLRRLEPADLTATEAVSAWTFGDADRCTRQVSDSGPTARTADESDMWIERARHFLTHDPDGCWIAARDDDVIGFALSQNRGGCWYLWTYGVAPGHQGNGVGAAMMAAVLAHADGRPGMLSSTVHPGATRRYRLAGFELHPQMRPGRRPDQVAALRLLGDRGRVRRDLRPHRRSPHRLHDERPGSPALPRVRGRP
jgi:GNAT superfamily N-acetyltransferase